MPRNYRQLISFADTTLGEAKNKHVLRYNDTIGRFQLIPFDTALDVSASDRDISDSFVEQLEEEIEVEEVQRFNYDGGNF